MNPFIAPLIIGTLSFIGVVFVILTINAQVLLPDWFVEITPIVAFVIAFILNLDIERKDFHKKPKLESDKQNRRDVN